jgi:hypothetical protein
MLGTFRRKLAALAIVAVAAAGIAVGTSLAGGGGRGQVVGGGSAAAPAVSDPVAGGVFVVAVAQGPANSTVGSTATPTMLPGMSVQVTVPAGQTALLVARFSAESACYGDDAGQPDWCIATITVNGNPMFPNTGTDFAFDSTDSGNATSASWESHAMERWMKVGPGTYTVRVLGSVRQFGSTTPTFWTGERELTVEASQIPSA